MTMCMMKTIKFVLFCCIIFGMTGFTGCGSDKNSFASIYAGANYYRVGDEETEELFSYLNTKDSEGLKSMFCEIITHSDNIDEQIQKALEFFEGELISYNRNGGASESKVRERGRTIIQLNSHRTSPNSTINRVRAFPILYIRGNIYQKRCLLHKGVN